MAKRFKVEITPEAEKDIADVWKYISKDSPKNASRFIACLMRQASTLEKFPYRGSLIPENAQFQKEYRHLIYKKYRTIYRIEKSTVFILRLVHGSRLINI